MNKYISLLVILFICLLLTGCWGYREIDSLYIIAGIAIDKFPDTDQYHVTAEFISIVENKMEGNFESVLLEAIGDSILDAINKMTRISAKKPYWGHASTIIISEEVAKEGIMPFLDLISRHQEGRLATNVYISKEISAKKILEVQSFSTDIRSYELAIMINENKHLITVPALKIYELINALSIPKVHSVLPTITLYPNVKEPTNIISGGAVFSMGKLVGFLGEEDVVPFLFIKDKVETGILNIKAGDKNPLNTIILQIFKSNTKVKPVYKDDTIGFDINIKTDVSIAEVTTVTDYISLPGREELKKIAEEYMENKIRNHIRDIQEEFGFDIFGFGNIIRQRNPKLWKDIEKDWDSIFMDLDLNINCDIHIKNSGYFLKQIKVVD